MLTFYLVRHGTTESNHKSIIMGQIDSPLTEKGLKNANTLAKKLKDLKFDFVYSSDLGRAFITAYRILEKLKIKPKISSSKELREINYGIYANRTKKEVKKDCIQYKINADYIFPKGESFYQMQNRVVKFIKKLERKHTNKKLLIITHAGVIRALNCFFNDYNLQDNLKIKITHEYIGEFVIDKGKLISYRKLN